MALRGAIAHVEPRSRTTHTGGAEGVSAKANGMAAPAPVAQESRRDANMLAAQTAERQEDFADEGSARLKELTEEEKATPARIGRSTGSGEDVTPVSAKPMEPPADAEGSGVASQKEHGAGLTEGERNALGQEEVVRGAKGVRTNVRYKKPKARGPNPLSVKKKIGKESAPRGDWGGAKKKRKRRGGADK